MKLYKYTFRSALHGSIHCEAAFSDTEGIKELDASEMASLMANSLKLGDFLHNLQEEMTQFLDGPLKECVHKLTVGDYTMLNGMLWLDAHVYTEHELTDEGIALVMDYLTGQYSDGWGESVSQRAWKRETVNYRVLTFDAFTNEWEEEDCYDQAEFFINPWWEQSFRLEYYDCTTVEVEDPRPSTLEDLATLVSQLTNRIDALEKKLNT